MVVKIFSLDKFFLKIFLVFLLSLPFAILFLAFFNSQYINVFAPERTLPIYSVETEDKVAALTFDCAWGADDIPEILEVLESRNVKASFFVVGQWAEKYPEKIKMIINHGHDLANHSYSHLRMSTLDTSRNTKEISLCGDILDKAAESKTTLFRAPYGDYNNDVIETAKRLGYYTIQWDVDSLDWKPGISRDEIIQRVFRKIRPGSILLFHNDTKYTAGLLPDLIDGLKDKGYDFLPVSELIVKEDYFIDHEGRQRMGVKANKNN